jgi:hypothetical protein
VRKGRCRMDRLSVRKRIGAFLPEQASLLQQNAFQRANANQTICFRIFNADHHRSRTR